MLRISKGGNNTEQYRLTYIKADSLVSQGPPRMVDRNVSQAAAKKTSIAIYARVREPWINRRRSTSQTTSLDPGPVWVVRKKYLGQRHIRINKMRNDEFRGSCSGAIILPRRSPRMTDVELSFLKDQVPWAL